MKSIDYYNKNSKRFISETFDVSMEPLLLEFAAYLKEGAAILDIGCGSGRDSKWFMEQGYDVWAHDGSAEMISYCRSFLGERVEQATFEDYSTERRFDGLWACASLLHVKRELLPEIIKKYSEVLKQGGIFFMSFKNRESDHEKDGRIFTNFNEKTITELLENIEELELVKVIYTVDIREDRQEEGWISVIAKKSCV